MPSHRSCAEKERETDDDVRTIVRAKTEVNGNAQPLRCADEGDANGETHVVVLDLFR